METADSLKQKFKCRTDKELGDLFHVGEKAVSAWRSKKRVPRKIEDRAQDMLSQGVGNSPTQINGDNHHIDINHVSERAEIYSPATALILDIIKDWDEKRRQKLAAKVVEMNGDE